MRLSRWVKVSRSESMITLFHEGSGRLLVFRPEASPGLAFLESNSEITNKELHDIDEELVSNLARYDFLE